MGTRHEALMNELQNLQDEMIRSMTGDEIALQMVKALNSDLYKTSAAKVQLLILDYYELALQAVRKREGKVCDPVKITYIEKAPQ